MGVDDDYAAWCLNEAVYFFGRSVEAEMDKASAKAKNEKSGNAARQKVLKRILDRDPNQPQQSRAAAFMDPADLFR